MKSLWKGRSLIQVIWRKGREEVTRESEVRRYVLEARGKKHVSKKREWSIEVNPTRNLSKFGTVKWSRDLGESYCEGDSIWSQIGLDECLWGGKNNTSRNYERCFNKVSHEEEIHYIFYLTFKEIHHPGISIYMKSLFLYVCVCVCVVILFHRVGIYCLY